MILPPDLTNRIRDHFDLNLYETKVWLALLSKGIASVGEVATLSRVPRSRTYDVLESLEKKGFAIIRMGKPVKYLGVKPHMILERMKEDVRKTAEERVKDLSKLKDTEEFVKLDELYKEGLNPVKKEELSASLKGKMNISNFLKEVIKNAKKEVIICANAEDIKSKTKLFVQTLEPLQKSRVKIKIALSGDSELIKELENKLSLKIKKTEIDSKFFIIDRKEIVFYLSRNGNDSDDVAVWLNTDFFAESFASLFEMAVGNN
ncbi:MAG: helix-turn-helix domain-containing protein [Candidatus Nanoarchaeia archaeon]|nr:helix-turn-helix domain-containing protein [Candidatus Nanoarchaeia archaeon]